MATQTDEQWWASIAASPAYKGLDIAREREKMRVWLTLHEGRKLTRRFAVNWLNKVEIPVTPVLVGRPQPPPFQKPVAEKPMTWEEWIAVAAEARRQLMKPGGLFRDIQERLAERAEENALRVREGQPALPLARATLPADQRREAGR